jgi:hypothetical protein
MELNVSNSYNQLNFIAMKSIFLSTAIFINVCLFAQNVKPIKAKLQKATVYLQGAHLYYNETVNLTQGINDIIFENISPSINITSLQANSKEGTVMEVRQNIKYKEQPKPTKKYEIEIERVQDSLENFKFIETELNNKLKVLANEKSLLTNNKLMRGELFNDSLLLLQNSLIFLKAKLNEIYEQETKVEIQKVESNGQLAGGLKNFLASQMHLSQRFFPVDILG